MGKVLEMTLRESAMFCAMAVLLTACGSEKNADPLLGGLKAVVAPVGKALSGKSGPAPTVPRSDLERLGVPITLGEIDASQTKFYIVPIAQTGMIETWSTSDDITATFRDGVLAATRGLGGDLMESATPSAARLRSGNGTTLRQYGVLDGGDRLVRYNYTCQLANLGAETISVLGRQHLTHHVAERCQGSGPAFTNDYWFESSGNIRKSSELLVPGLGHVVLFRVVDK
jgi:hypothetical protein